MQTLVIGGLWRFVEQNLLTFFAEYGFVVDQRHHIPLDRGFVGPIPADVEVVIVLSEMIANSGKSTNLAKRLAADRGLPCIVGSRHKAMLRPIIESHGFKRVLAPWSASALIAEENDVSTKPNPAPTDLNGLSFDQLSNKLAEILRALRDRHGVSEVTWGKETMLEMRRMEVRNISLDT